MGWGSWELLIIAGVFLLLFGGAKLPGLMRNLGRSVNEFKAGIKDPVDQSRINDDSDNEKSDDSNGGKSDDSDEDK